MSRHRVSRVTSAAAMVLALVVAGCSSGGGEGVGSSTLDGGSASTVAPKPSWAPTTSEVPTTASVPLPDPSEPAESVGVPDGSVAPTPTGRYVPAPGGEWETAVLPSGVDVEVLDAAVDRAFGGAQQLARVRSIVVVQGGRIVYERYHPLDGPDEVMESFSVAKSFTSAVVGLLVGDGLLATESPAPVEAWAAPGDPRGSITVEHLLHMASGLAWEEQYGPGSPPVEMLLAPNAADYVASQPLEHPPGAVFEYSTGTTALLAGIVTAALGGPEQTDRYLDERLLGPIGITSTRLVRDRSGVWVGGLGADSTTRDFARFGLLFARDGRWGDRQVLPAGWVDYSCTPSPANAEYGAQWWMRREGACEARGLFGQLVVVARDLDLVVAINTAPGGDADSLLETVYGEFTAALAVV